MLRPISWEPSQLFQELWMQVWPQTPLPLVGERCGTNKRFCVFTGYGFVDFDSPAAAQKAVASLKANGVQAQMAKVRLGFRYFFFCDLIFLHYCEQNQNWRLQWFGLYLLGRENKKPSKSFGLEEPGWFISLFSVCISVYIY